MYELGLVDSMEEVEQTWNSVDQQFRKILSNELSTFPSQSATYRSHLAQQLSLLNRNHLIAVLREYLVQHFTSSLHTTVIPHFLNSYSAAAAAAAIHKTTAADKNLLKRFIEMVEGLQYSTSAALQAMSHLDSFQIPDMQCLPIAILRFRALLSADLPDGCSELSVKLLVQMFKTYCLANEVQAISFSSPSTPSKSRHSQAISREVTEAKQLIDKLKSCFNFFSTLGVFNELVADHLEDAIRMVLKESITELLTINFKDADQEYSTVMSFVEGTCVSFVLSVVGDQDSEQLDRWKEFLREIMVREMCHVRIDQLFMMIVEYPDSSPAVENLRTLLEDRGMSAYLVESVRLAYERRLLHPGASTNDILTQYINSIRVLSHLDKSCSILDRVCDPVIRYLRAREDTVRCIVSNMTEDADLAGELLQRRELQLIDAQDSDDEVDWQTWRPSPRELHSDPSDRKRVSHTHKNMDIMSILVNIYGTKELFVNEYRNLLADRILSNNNFDGDKERRHLELLSYRFGQDEINKCSVMLRDVAESKKSTDLLEARWKTADNTDPKPDFSVSPIILSAQFWPTLREEKLTLPARVQHSLDAYKKSYEVLKSTRTVEWMPHLGKVEVEIQVGDTVQTKSLTPTQAAVLVILEERGKVSWDELSNLLSVAVAPLRRKLACLFSAGLVVEREGGVIEPLEVRAMETSIGGTAGAAAGVTSFHSDDEEADSAMMTGNDLKQEDLNCYWMYTVSMLRNMKSLTAERIHSMLKMFSKAGSNSTELSQEDLTFFLNSKVKQEQLVYSNGVYRLPDKT